MKKLIVLLLLTISAGLFAQTVPLALRMDLQTRVTFEEKGYLKQGVGTLTIQVNPITVKAYKSSGQFYIDYTNSRGYAAKKSLGFAWLLPLNDSIMAYNEYEGNTIFYSKDTTRCWIWTVDRYGQIFKMNLPDYMADWTRVIKDTIQ